MLVRSSVSSKDMAVIKLLLAEDDAAMAEMYRSVLVAEGWEVHVARNGRLALEAAMAEPPSLVLLDIEMPQLNGIEVLTALRECDRTAAIPVIVISNSPGAHSMEDAYALGISAWAVKSHTSPQALVNLVRGYLGV